MWGLEFKSDEPMAYAIFGVQCQRDQETADNGAASAAAAAAKEALVQTLDVLITQSAKHTDKIVEDGPLDGWFTKIWLSYWPSAEQLDAWWESPSVSKFWGSLAADSGVYREILKVSPKRTQFVTTREMDSGLAHVASLAPKAKFGYWGSYRDNIKDATREERLDSTLEQAPERTPVTGTVRLGRTRMTQFPEHLCFVVEGQDHSEITADERQHWLERFDQTVTNWMQDIRVAGPQAGVLDTRYGYAAASGSFRDQTADEPASLGLAYNRKIQLFYFLDLRHFERIGRANKGHVALRRDFMDSYGPDGAMGAAHGRLLLWAESSILKASEVECEYVGCLEGTGLMAYDHAPAFGSRAGE